MINVQSAKMELAALRSIQADLLRRHAALSREAKAATEDHKVFSLFDRMAPLMRVISDMEDKIWDLEVRIEEATYNDYSGDNPQM